ncbi:protein peste-like isoform X2 [Zootermopsis nevadensis]|nr:protein peste-like isoform X2 [Zootermopsis nevadensis]XP_021916771.1 protein peste-like isoform X2 [Zootermopsis nevadensis]
MPLTVELYFFNWTNPDELMNEGFRPNLIEMGPYRFKEFLEKTNVTWNTNRTITFRRLRRWYFDGENSNGTLDDSVTTLNPVALSAAYVSRFRSSFIQYTLSSTLLMTGQKVWVTRTVREFMFDGYSDPLLTVATKFPHVTQSRFTADKFAWFYKRNDSSEHEGVFNVDTGEEDTSTIGVLRAWNFKNRSDSFEANCGEIKGSVGDLFPPGQKKDKPLQMFSADFCKSIQFDYSEETEVLGIPGYVYAGSKSIMDNGTADPDTWCNCGGECVPQGVLNISACRYGAPGFVSYPHFLDADPIFSQKIKGMSPNPEKHRMYVTLEPTTGIPLDVAGRFQINLLLQPSRSISLYNDVPTVLFPIMWFEESVRITPELAGKLKLLLALPAIGLFFSVGLILLGLVVLAVATVPRALRNMQWRLLRHRKEKVATRRRYQVSFLNENSRPLVAAAGPTHEDADVK